MTDLSGLKVGDKVYIRPSSPMTRPYLSMVERKTPKQIVCSQSKRFWIANGRSVDGGEWHRSFARPATEEDIRAIEDQRVRNSAMTTIQRERLSSLSTDQLIRIVAIMAEGDEG